MRNIKIFLIFLTLFVICLFPIKVNAKSYESDYVKAETANDTLFEANEFELLIHYDSGVGADALGISGDCKGKDPTFYYYHYIFTFFDSNKKELFEINGHGWTQDITNNPNGIKMSDYFLHKDYSKFEYFPYNEESPVKYYKLYIEPSTYENANEYIVARNNKAKTGQYYPKIDNDTMLLTAKSKNGEYEISKYKIDIVVNENNTFNIIENISANFFINKHGIFRKIPLRNEVVRLDGTKSINRARISNISVNEQYTTSTESGYRVIKIGDPYNTLTGSKDYVIKYLYDIGKDTGKEYDEFYFNIIGNEWDTTSSNVGFTITMPKEFDKTKLGFSSGVVGSTDSSKIEYNVDGNVISGKYNGVLNAGESLTARLELPEGYFVGANGNFTPMIILLFALPIAFAIISFLLWIIYGKDKKVIETIEFYPPEDFNSVEVGFLYKGQADVNDVVSLLIYLANKGYVRIEESEEKALFSSKKRFIIKKLKEYNGGKSEEQIFFNGLFKNGKTEVKPTDLYDEFYKTTNKILKIINDKENRHKIFEKFTSVKSIAVIIMIIVSLVTIISIPTLEYAGVEELGTTLFITLFYVPFYAVIFIKKVPLFFKIIWGGFTILHSFAFFSSLPIKEAIFNDPTLLSGFLIGLTCIIAMIFCYKIMPKRTSYGNEILGKIKGFRTFLETAEKPKLEELVMQNPSYFYNILPFTYVLGVSNKWIKKFETINLQAPDWYSGSTAFSVVSFGSFIDSTMSSASTAMSSSPSSSVSGSGGGSGGGSSGGGSGGGGGGSW